MRNKQTPEIRFAGVIGDWEERRLGEGTLKIGDGLHGTPQYSVNGNIAFINGNNLVNGKIMINSQTKYVNSDQQSQDDKELNQNTILMSINGTIGNLAWYNGEKVMLGKSAAYIEVSSFDKNFMYQLLQTSKIKSYFLNNLTGTTIKNLGLKTIRETPTSVPKIDEQKLIGNFFKQLDYTIDLHQQELTTLKQTRQGFLQKMFPKEGESVPEVRFPGFTGDWEQRKLNEVAEIIGGGTPSTDVREYWDGDIDWYSPVEIGKETYAFGSQRKITALGLKKSSAKVLPANNTILFTSRAGIGDMAILKKDGATNQGFQSLVVNNNFDIYFVYSMGNKIKEFALKHASGSTFLEISGKGLGKMDLFVPSTEEQAKIGNFFKQLDETIALHQRELDALKETKKAFLQKMFA